MAGKIQIPEELKQDLPHTTWGKILGSTPIVMTVIATMLAGLASSEMTKAQYDRAYAAQLQSKAGDQWGYFQAKKLRSALAQNSFDLLAATAEVPPLTAANLPGAGAATIKALVKGEMPAAQPPVFAGNLKAALSALETSQDETEIAQKLAAIKPAALSAALTDAKNAADAFDAATGPINQDSDRLDGALMAGDKSVFRSFSAARLRYNASRYDREARLNQSIANIYELQVRQNNISAEKHHNRSKNFFFGMLAAQLAVIVSTFAIAARKKNLLWSLAAGAGAVAVCFSIYVYLRV
jgi:hypothetical protein